MMYTYGNMLQCHTLQLLDVLPVVILVRDNILLRLCIIADVI